MVFLKKNFATRKLAVRKCPQDDLALYVTFDIKLPTDSISLTFRKKSSRGLKAVGKNKGYLTLGGLKKIGGPTKI